MRILNPLLLAGAFLLAVAALAPMASASGTCDDVITGVPGVQHCEGYYFWGTTLCGYSYYDVGGDAVWYEDCHQYCIDDGGTCLQG